MRSKFAESAPLGFTVIELMVALTLSLLVSFAAVPYVSGLLGSLNKRNAEMMLLEDMRLIQALTVEEGCQGILLLASNHKSYSFGCDYIPFSTANPPTYDSVRFTHTLPRDVEMTYDGLIIFNSRGQAIDETGNLTTRSITLAIRKNSVLTTFNVGTLRATGFFSFMN